MTDQTRALASAAITLAVLVKKITTANADIRERLTKALEPGDRKAGYAGDTKIGGATLTDPKPAWRVIDRNAFTDWVRANRPDEIITIDVINAPFEKAILDQGGYLDRATGEVLPIPGTEYQRGVPVLQVRPEPGAEQAIRAELDRDGLSFTQLLESLTRKEIEP